MTKHDWFWVFVKVAGLAMLSYSVFTFVMLITLFGDISFGSALVRLLLSVGVMGGIGVWLIRDGKLLTDWARASERKVLPD